MLRMYFDDTNELWAAEEAAAAGRAAVGLERDPAKLVAALTNLGIALYARHEATSEQPMLVEAVTVLRQAAHSCPFDEPLRPKILYHLAIALRLAYEDAGDPALLEEAIAAGRPASRVASPIQLPATVNLTINLLDLSYRREHMSLLGEAVSTARWAVLLGTAAGPTRQSECLLVLARTLGDVGHRSGDVSALQEAVAVGEAAIASHPDPVRRQLQALIVDQIRCQLRRRLE